MKHRLRDVICCLALAALSPAAAFAQQQAPKLDDVLRSINESSRGQTQEIDWTPVLLLLLAVVMAYLAIKHWNRRAQKPKTLASHAKLLKQAQSVTGVSARNLKQLEGLAKAQGLSSPLVAMLCPSVVTKLAKNVRTESERKAVVELASHVLKP